MSLGLRVLVLTVVHDPEDARIRYRELLALTSAGHSVTYAAPFTAYSRTPPGGVTPVDLPRAVGRRRLRALLAAYRLLRREAGSHDVVLIHDPELLLAALAAKLGGPGASGPVVVWDVHEDWPASMSLKPWLPQRLRRPAGRVAAAVQSLAERRFRLLLAEYGYAANFRSPHPVVPNTVPVPATEPPPPGTDRVVYVGRVTRARGGRELVRVGQLLAPDVTLEIIGNADPEVADIVRQASERGQVRWRGFLPNTEALRAIDGALAGLVLLHDEPNYAHSRFTKIMEYMAHGVPVITTPNPAAAEFVRRCGCGIVVPFGDPEAAASAVRRLRDDAHLRERLARSGRKHAVAEFDWDRDGRAFVRQLEEWVRHERTDR